MPDPTLSPAPTHADHVLAGPTGVEERPLTVAPAAAPVTPAGADEVAQEPLARNRDFLSVLIGQSISSFGDSISNTAMPLLVLALTGSGFAMGIVGVLGTLPDLIVGLPAGAFADRWDRRKMMFWADLGRALLTALIPISAWLGGPTMAVILLVTFPINALRVLWLSAYTAAVPGLVGRPQVPRASALFEAIFNIGWIAGPAMAGVLSALIGPGPTIALDAVSFVISASALLLVRRSLRAGERSEPTHIVADIREGLAFVAGHTALRWVIVFWTVTQILLAGLTSGLIFYITKDRAMGSEVVGLVLSAFSVGALSGSLLVARVAPRAVGRTMLVGQAITGSTLVVSVGAGAPVMAAAAFVAGVASAFVMVSYISLRTLLSPDALLGRVGATARTFSVGLMPVGAIIAGAGLDAIGGGPVLLIMGGGMVATAAVFAFVPDLRRARLHA